MEGLTDMFLQDGTQEHITETYEFPQSQVKLNIQQMEYENCQLQVGVPLVVWRASLCLSQWLDTNHAEWVKESSLRALELGSGTGLLGLFTIKRLLQANESSSITLTDMEQSVSTYQLYIYIVTRSDKAEHHHKLPLSNLGFRHIPEVGGLLRDIH